MRVFIVGGTGLLGYHAALEFLRRGHEVETAAIPDIPLGDWFPKQIRVHEIDIFASTGRRRTRLFKGFDAMVYAVGPDDRQTPPAPAYDFFHERLVEGCGRVVAAAREAGVRRCAVLGSYLAYFDRLWPEQRLAAHHPYIRCRAEQAERVFAEGGGSMRVSVLELPYIFGVMPEREPLWKQVLLDRLVKMPVVLYPAGGSAMISAKHVGEAVVGAIVHGKHGHCYPIGDENLSWDEMLGLMLQTLGIDKTVYHLPPIAGGLLGRGLRVVESLRGLEHGLDHEHLIRNLMSAKLYVDPAPSAKALRHGRGGVREAIVETTRACYPERFGDRLRD